MALKKKTTRPATRKARTPEKVEAVNHPAHYRGADDPYEVIKVIEVSNFDFNTGNAFKYLARAGIKHPETEVEDLEKCIWYVQRRIARIKGELPHVAEQDAE